MAACTGAPCDFAREHGAYLAGLGEGGTDPDAFLRGGAEQLAPRFGGRLAVGFERYLV